MTREEKIASDMLRLSLAHDGERDQVATPNSPIMPSNYEVAKREALDSSTAGEGRLSARH